METDLSFVEDLAPARSFWNIKCKIIKIWKQSYRWDLILLDSKGKKIQCCVKSSLLSVFESLLKEDYVVIIRNCGVGDQKDRLRVIDLDFKINFFKSVTTPRMVLLPGGRLNNSVASTFTHSKLPLILKKLHEK